MSGILDRAVQEMERVDEAAGKLDLTSGAELAAITRCMSDIRPEPVSWLWPGLIARGKVTLIAGDPGLGKSQLTAALAACVSAGACWPIDGSAAPCGNVLILSAEDDAADTIRPRLDAAKADVSRIHVLEAVRVCDENGCVAQRGFDLARDIEILRNAACSIGNVVLIVIDPISAYLGGTDSHRNADVRGLLSPLAALAAQIGAAMVIVSHLNKSASSDALTRVTGSLAFVAASRAAYLVVRDPQDPARRLFVPAKNNIGPDRGVGLAFRIEPVSLDGAITTSRIEWEPDVVTMTANEALAAGASHAEERSALDDTIQFLQELLADGPVAAKEVQRAVRDAGLSWATARRAKQALRIRTDKKGYQGAWRWSLPAKVPKGPEDAQLNDMGTFARDEQLCTANPNPAEGPARASGFVRADEDFPPQPVPAHDRG